MKWLEGNPLGMVLVAISGVFTLMVLVMGIVWTLPVSVEIVDIETGNTTGIDETLAANTIGSLGEYQVINQKPVFNESRQPVDSLVDDSQLEDAQIEVNKDAPDVKLTGVIITPSMKIASLTPADGKLESVMAHEGQSLTGEYVGWQVSEVNPRTVVLKSSGGQKLELDLQVHDAKIKEPPAPAVPAQAALATSNPGGQADDDEEPLSRAEQIRQRIAQRREELRLEQEAQKTPNETRAGSSNSSPPSQYQNAIRSMMNNKSKDKGANDKKD